MRVVLPITAVIRMERLLVVRADVARRRCLSPLTLLMFLETY